MALAGSLGEQVLNVLVGLGLSWLVYDLANVRSGAVVTLSTGLVPAMITIAMAALFVVLLAMSRFQAHRWQGVALMSAYLLFLGYELVAGLVLGQS